MSVDLMNVSGETIGIGNTGWSKLITLAMEGGWEPQGTRPPIDQNAENWNSVDYFTNAGQWVSKEDAQKIADAIASRMDTIPDKDDEPDKIYVGTEGLFEMIALTPQQYWAGSKDRLNEFITFFRQGEFQIW